MAQKPKILLCGDVEGKFDALYKRISAINTKSGPFEGVFCVGNFFGVNNKEFEAYKTGAKQAPVPTYILGANDTDREKLYPDDDSLELAPNIFSLGKRGVYTVAGLKIAYISGIFGDTSTRCEHNPKDVSDLYDACVRGNPTFRGVDVLITSQWPADLNKTIPVNKPSEAATWLALKLKPRYHISGLEGLYYESPPFRCPNLGEHDTTISITTRFLGLARVGNANKDKWVYALSLTPLDSMKVSELLQKTTDEIDCPFDFAETDRKVFNTKRKAAATNQYFYATNVDEESQGRSNKRGKRQKIEFDQSKCWFCLASPSVEKHLIVNVGSLAYLAVAKGGLVDEHLLICPIEHYQNSLDMPEEVLKEIERFKDAVRKFYARSGNAAVFFERNYKTSHMQMQAVPVPQKVEQELKYVFMEEAEGHGLGLSELAERARLDQVLQKNVPYFTVELPDGMVLYTRVRGAGDFPLNFGREVLATPPILNMPERIDWRGCTLGRGAEEELVERLRTDFQPFDFSEDA